MHIHSIKENRVPFLSKDDASFGEEKTKTEKIS
jgi:hypothetical protein